MTGAAAAATADKPWPPASGDGQLFVHFGEEHVNDEDGATLLPKILGQAPKPAQATDKPRPITGEPAHAAAG